MGGTEDRCTVGYGGVRQWMVVLYGVLYSMGEYSGLQLLIQYCFRTCSTSEPAWVALPEEPPQFPLLDPLAPQGGQEGPEERSFLRLSKEEDTRNANMGQHG